MNESSKYLDISGVDSKKIRNRIYRVGIELEGGWTALPPGLSHIERDGSVQFPQFYQSGDHCYDPLTRASICQKGEIPSPPLLPDSKKPADPLNMEKWLRNHWPQYINETCGMHVHMSFRNAFVYMTLMEERFMWTVLEFIKRWADAQVVKGTLAADHCIFPRIEGKSEYCQHVFLADDQAQKVRKEYDHHGQGHRYTVINFPFSRQGTVECRLLPMMSTVDLALEAIKEVMNITNAYLYQVAAMDNLVIDGKNAGKNDKEIESKWVAEGDEVHSERIEVRA